LEEELCKGELVMVRPPVICVKSPKISPPVMSRAVTPLSTVPVSGLAEEVLPLGRTGIKLIPPDWLIPPPIPPLATRAGKVFPHRVNVVEAVKLPISALPASKFVVMVMVPEAVQLPEPVEPASRHDETVPLPLPVSE
jgi:hypothetical protein